MKLLIILTGLAVAVILSFYKGATKKHNIYWKITVIIIAIGAIIMNLLPPVAAEFIETDYYASHGFSSPINTLLLGDSYNLSGKSILYKDKRLDYVDTIMLPDNIDESALKSGKNVLAEILYDSSAAKLRIVSINTVEPIMYLPFIPALQERIRIMNFHVPMSWVAVLSYLISMIYSVRFLRKRDIREDIKASAAASLGVVFTLLATVTGMVWAKFNWGSFWNWDPRETSIFILLLIYFAYFALRSAVPNEEQRGRLSAVYSIIAFVTVPFLVFVLPRIATGLHPGAGGEANSGPILSTRTSMLDSQLLFGFSISLAAFTMIFAWMFNIGIRTNILKYLQSIRKTK
ncbi:MAG: heme exporter protein [Bacteroidota bacterium]|nr:heme exporter protein [Bacteroidota bacterium]